MKYKIRFQELIISECIVEADSKNEAIISFEDYCPDDCTQVDHNLLDGGMLYEILDIELMGDKDDTKI